MESSQSRIFESFSCKCPENLEEYPKAPLCKGGFGRFLANVAELCYYYKEKGTICGKPIKQ